MAASDTDSSAMRRGASATRDASNREEFFDITRRHLGRVREGAMAQVISGEQEAELSFRGAITDLPDAQDRTVCVIDLGGGSSTATLSAMLCLFASASSVKK